MMKTRVTWSLPFLRPENLRGELNGFFLPLLDHWEHAGMPEHFAPTGYAPQLASDVDGSNFYIKVDLPGVEPSGELLSLR